MRPQDIEHLRGLPAGMQRRPQRLPGEHGAGQLQGEETLADVGLSHDQQLSGGGEQAGEHFWWDEHGGFNGNPGRVERAGHGRWKIENMRVARENPVTTAINPLRDH